MYPDVLHTDLHLKYLPFRSLELKYPRFVQLIQIYQHLIALELVLVVIQKIELYHYLMVLAGVVPPE
jgi:hypothetical protein